MRDFYILFAEELKKMYSASTQIAKDLTYMIKASSSSRLKHVLRQHLRETRKQTARIKEIASEFNENLRNSKNTSVTHLLHEGKKVIQHWHQDKATRDAAIIMHMQKIQHYEMASYGNLKAFARHFKLPHTLELLEESSKEEGSFNKKLTELAEGTVFDCGINARACRKCA